LGAVVHTDSNEIVMDFLVGRVDNRTLFLNAVSPVFISTFSFAKYILIYKRS
jgi:hypothetical protein|tara:strand:+ start:199 stop:354 length:156 start_codon:yes stop_codon:yes gene_type:complete